SSQRPDTLMQDRTSANSMKVLLQRAAGPYIGVKTGSALAEHKISASSAKPDICALMSTHPSTRSRSRENSRRDAARLLAAQGELASRSHHPQLRILDKAMETGLRRLAVEREREVAERVGRMRGPVVHRLGPQRLQLVVVFGAVELERIDPARAFLRVEPAFRQDHAHGVDTVLHPMQRGNADVLEAQAFQHLEAALAGAELLGLGIVRHDGMGSSFSRDLSVAAACTVAPW